MTAPPTGHGSHEVGRQDLTGVAAGTEPGSLDDRVPEVVTVLVADLAHAQPNAQSDWFSTLAVALFDALLHAYCAPQSRGCRTEHHH